LELAVPLVVLALAVATLPLLREARRARSALVRRGAPVVWGLAALAAGAAAAREGTPPWSLRTLEERPLELASDGYVSSDECQACHPGEYDSWYDTYHRTMSHAAVEGAVQAPFDGRVLGDAALGERFVPFRRGDEYWVELVDPYHEGPGPAPTVQRRVVQTTGSHHQQLYWFATGHTRALGLFPYGFRLDEARWRPIGAIFLTPPRGGQSTVLGRWNTSCQKCHATHGQARFTSAAEMDTRVAELGIACEMCHGPAAEHVAANRNPLRRYRLHDGEERDATIVNPADLTVERSTQVCGQCHGVTHLKTQEARRDWVKNGFSFRPGDDLLVSRGLGEPDAEAADRKFWKDGQMRVTGREYTALQRTPCFQAGAMSCLACHRMHQAADDPRPREVWRNDLLSEGMDGDRACTQCHGQFDDGTALEAHTHHARASSGSRCLDCHMPHTTYGLLGGIRNHEVGGPTVQESLATGRPNACNQCHLDRTLAWTAEHLHEWYGTSVPELGEAERTLAASVLWTLQGDAGERALMAWSFGWREARAASGEDWIAPYLALLMNDPYHAVRFIAGRSAGELGLLEGVEYDHLDAPERREAAAGELLEGWARARAAGEPARPELLLGPGGVWLEDTVDALLDGRDNSDVVLQE